MEVVGFHAWTNLLNFLAVLVWFLFMQLCYKLTNANVGFVHSSIQNIWMAPIEDVYLSRQKLHSNNFVNTCLCSKRRLKVLLWTCWDRPLLHLNPKVTGNRSLSIHLLFWHSFIYLLFTLLLLFLFLQLCFICSLFCHFCFM